MAIQSNFRGNLTASGEKTAGPGRFGTGGLSGLSDFATHPDDKRRWGTALKKLAMTVALNACASPALADTLPRAGTAGCDRAPEGRREMESLLQAEIQRRRLWRSPRIVCHEGL